MKISFEHVSKTYNEIERRLEIMAGDGALDSEFEFLEQRKAMLEGVYSTFMMISDNWPETRHFCDLVERERSY